MKKNMQLTIYKCAICKTQLNSYKRAKTLNVITQQKSRGFKSEIICRACLKKNFLQCKHCGKIIVDLRPYLLEKIPTCVKCKDEVRELLEDTEDTKPKDLLDNIPAAQRKCCND